MPYTQIAVFKNKDATGKQPAYRLVSKDENDKSITIGSLWVKDYKGIEFQSGEMKKEFTKEDGTKYEGYVILSQTEYKDLLAGKNGAVESSTESINADEINF